MIILGLTGSIGMGKTTVASQLTQCGIPVCSADTIVHKLLAKGGAAVAPVAEIFPETLEDGAINRTRLGEIVFTDKAQMTRLEHIIHPLVVSEENNFLEQQRKLSARMVVLDIPLLFETEAEKRCNAVIVVTAPAWIQKRRVLQRKGMTKEKFARILAQQMPDEQKRRRADFIIHTGMGKAYSLYQVKRLLRGFYA